MNPYYLIAILLFPILVCMEAGEQTTRLKMIQPNWRFEVHERFSDGTPKILLFYAPVPGEDREAAVKQIVYNSNNTVASESDLIQLESPGRPILFNGPQIHYDGNGAVSRIVFYNNGKREGQAKVFYSSGVLKAFMTYHADELEGPAETYYENGRLKEKFSYMKGKRHGDYESLYDTGTRASQAKYEKGLIIGLYQEWHEKGSPKAELYYLKGLLNNDNHRPALKRYYEDHSVQEIQNFLLGVPHGEHLEFYPNGELKYKALYKKGVNEGNEKEISYQSQDKLQYPLSHPKDEGKKGQELPVTTYQDIAMPDGEHKQYYDLQEGQTEPKLAKVNHYANGMLEGEQRAYYPNGQLKAVAAYQQGILHGTKKHWNDKGGLIVEAAYEQGLLNGRYYTRHPDGTEQISHYKNNQFHGLHEIYYSEDPFFGRVKALEAYYENGRLEGQLIKYNPAGTKTMSASYHQGIKEGLSLFYTDEGHLVLSAEFKNDLQHGATRKYYPSGKLRKESLFSNGEKTGEEKTFYENERLASLRFYKDGHFDGLCQEWNSEGILIFEGEYQKGKKHGKFNKYDDTGQPLVLQIFQEDRLIEKKISTHREGICDPLSTF